MPPGHPHRPPPRSAHSLLAPPLAPGARVALVAPAGPLRGEEDVARAVGNARAFGWEPVVAPHALARRGYFAGSDADRASDLNAALADPTVDGIWCLRGGYGAMRVLDLLDYDALRRRPKAIIGYSDITALHLAVAARCDLVTFHGPTARAELTPFSRDSLERAVVHATDPCGAAPDARTLRPGRAAGRLVGGNLALLAALAGTAFAPRLDGALLVLEDVNEAVYRVDRMLQQLHLAGALDGCRGIVAGQFTDCPEESDDGARRLDDVLAELAEALGVPCLAGVPVGHIDDQWTLPLGVWAELDADARTVHVDGVAARRVADSGWGPPPEDHVTPPPIPVWHRSAADTSVLTLDARRSTLGQPSTIRDQEPPSMPNKSASDLIAEAKQRIKEVTPKDVRDMRERGDEVTIVDVREDREWNLGHVPGAMHLSRGTLESKIEPVIPRERPVVLYCASGNRSALAADTLQQMGYTNVASMSGGIRGWMEAGGDIEG